jgi:hypothetical protein
MLTHPARRLSLALAAAITLIGAASTAGADSKTKLRLITSGSGAKQALRYKLTPGSRETVKTSTLITMKTTVMNMPSSLDLPIIEMVMDFEVGKKPTKAGMPYRSKVTAAKVRPRKGAPSGTVAYMKQAVGKLVGLTGSARVDDRGVTSEVKWSYPTKVPAAMMQMLQSSQDHLDQASLPLPEQPVGVGAVWQVRRKMVVRGIKLAQTATYKLVKLAGKRGTIEIHLSQNAPVQHVKVPGLKVEGKGPELTKFNSTGVGTITFDLGKLVPKVELSLAADYTMRTPIRGRLRDVRSVIETKLVVAPK